MEAGYLGKRYATEEIPYLQVCGRVAKRKGKYTFFWTGSGMEFRVTGKELWVETEVAEDMLPPWICIYLNGRLLSRQILLPGRQTLCVYTGLNCEGAKHIRLIKESPAMFDGHDSSFSVLGLVSDGCFKPLREKKYRLEIIGDSITSGEGLYGMPEYKEWDLWFFTARPEYHYGMQTAEKLDADVSIISQSGWGIATGCDNCPSHNVPSIYGKICGVQTAESAGKAGAWEEHRFQEWQPDIILIHLGTNDVAAFRNPSWENPKNGKLYKMRLEKDGSFAKKDEEKIRQAAYDFLCEVRRNNPKALILWIYGMMKNELEDVLRRTVEKYAEKNADARVGYLSLPDTEEGEFGAVDHPGRLAHKKAAEVICRAIEERLSGEGIKI